MKQMQLKWWELSVALFLGVVLGLAVTPAKAQQKVDERFAARTSYCWGSSGNQGVFCNHEPVIVRVPGPVQVVDRPVVVPGPTKVERVEVPAPPVSPAKQRE